MKNNKKAFSTKKYNTTFKYKVISPEIAQVKTRTILRILSDAFKNGKRLSNNGQEPPALAAGLKGDLRQLPATKPYGLW